MVDKQFNVACPITLASGTTAWVNVGRAFKTDGAKYAMKVSISAIPVTMFKGDPVDLFLFDAEDQRHREQKPRKNLPSNYFDAEPPPPGDEDLPF
jgi:hypothetical protein